MVAQQQTATFNGEVVRNIAGTLIWGAQPLEQSEIPNWDWLAHPHPHPNREEVQRAIQELTATFRTRYENINRICLIFHPRLQKAIDRHPPGQEIDPDDTAVAALEKGEAYFHQEREELHAIRESLLRTGVAATHGAEVFKALEHLDMLFEDIVAAFQKFRWGILIHDGSLAPSTGGTCKSGAEFLASLEKL